MNIIPAIDIIDGKCVRLTKGDYNTQRTYSNHPLEIAKQFEDNGIKHLHIVDLDGAKSKHIVNHKVLEEIASNTNLHIDFGGGLKSKQDVDIAFNSGAHQITGGSIAVTDRVEFESWISDYGSDKIILGADCNNRKVATNGWTKESELDVLDFIMSYQVLGIKDTICTDISKDGMLRGPSFELYEELIQNTKVNIIASGGVSCFDDLKKLKQLGCSGAIVGKAFYEGKISITQLSELC